MSYSNQTKSCPVGAPPRLRSALDQLESSDATAPTTPAGMHIALDPDNVKNGLGKLVLTLVEVIRELLERQAIRRIEAGSLSDVEIERIGTTFLRLSEQMTVLKATFGLEGEDLNLDLGPLGTLLDDCRVDQACYTENGIPEERTKRSTSSSNGVIQMSSTRSESQITEERELLKCAFCHGRGTDPYNVMSELSVCSVCGGRGVVSVRVPHEPCHYCAGTGSYKTYRCQVCDGAGVIAAAEGETRTCPDCCGLAFEQSSGLPCLTCHGRSTVPL